MKKLLIYTALLVMAAALILAGCGGSNSANQDSWAKIEAKGEFVLGLEPPPLRTDPIP